MDFILLHGHADAVDEGRPPCAQVIAPNTLTPSVIVYRYGHLLLPFFNAVTGVMVVTVSIARHDGVNDEADHLFQVLHRCASLSRC